MCARSPHVRVAENVSVSSPSFLSFPLRPSVSLFLAHVHTHTYFLSLFLSFVSSPLFLRCLFSPYTVSIRRAPRLELSFPPRAFAESRESERETGGREPRESLPLSYYGKNEVAYFLCLVTNRLSSPGRRPENETKILLVGPGRAPTREITARSGITIIKLLSIDKLHVTAGQVEAFSNLSDVVAHRRKEARAENDWRWRERKREKETGGKIQLLVLYINSLERARKQAMLL